MKKKYLSIVFLIIGLILISLSIILAIIATVNKDIIGGAGFSTFVLVFLRGNRGGIEDETAQGKKIRIRSDFYKNKHPGMR